MLRGWNLIYLKIWFSIHQPALCGWFFLLHGWLVDGSTYYTDKKTSQSPSTPQWHGATLLDLVGGRWWSSTLKRHRSEERALAPTLVNGLAHTTFSLFNKSCFRGCHGMWLFWVGHFVFFKGGIGMQVISQVVYWYITNWYIYICMVISWKRKSEDQLFG